MTFRKMMLLSLICYYSKRIPSNISAYTKFQVSTLVRHFFTASWINQRNWRKARNSTLRVERRKRANADEREVGRTRPNWSRLSIIEPSTANFTQPWWRCRGRSSHRGVLGGEAPRLKKATLKVENIIFHELYTNIIPLDTQRRGSVPFFTEKIVQTLFFSNKK